MTIYASTYIHCDFPTYLRELGLDVPQDYVLSDCIIMLEKLEEEFCLTPLHRGWNKPQTFVKDSVEHLRGDHKRLCMLLDKSFLDGIETFGQLSDLLIRLEKNMLNKIADKDGFVQVKDYIQLLLSFTSQDFCEAQEALLERGVTSESFWVGDFIMRALPYTPYSRLLHRAIKQQTDLEL